MMEEMGWKGVCFSCDFLAECAQFDYIGVDFKVEQRFPQLFSWQYTT